MRSTSNATLWETPRLLLRCAAETNVMQQRREGTPGRMIPGPLALLQRLPATVRLLIAGTLLNKLGTFIVPYLTIVLRREFHLSAGQIGGLLTAYGVGSIVSVLVGGVLTDRIGRRVTLLLSLIGSGLLAIAMGLSPSIRVFVPLLVMFGFLADLYRPAAAAIIGDLLPSAQRAMGFAALRLAVNLGFAFGMAVGGVIADWSWRLLFLGDGLTTVLFGFTVFLFIPETHPSAILARGPRAAPSASPWRDPVFLEMLFVSLAFAFLFFTHMTALPLTITLSAGYPARYYGFLVGANGLLIALFELSMVEQLRRFRRLRVAALGMALAGVGFAATGLMLHWSWFLVTVLVWTAGEILSAPQQMAFVADWAPPASRGRYLSLYQASWSVALALNPVLALPLHARLPEPVFWSLMLVVALPASWVLLRLDRSADRPELLRGREHSVVEEESHLPSAAPEV